MSEGTPIRINFETGLTSVEDMRVTTVHGTEAISELFQFDIDLTSEVGLLELNDMMGRPAKLTFVDEEGDRCIWGIVARFEVTGIGERRVRYRARLVPRAWLLTMRRKSRIFQSKMTPDIIREVFEDAGLDSGDDFRIDTQAAYIQHEFCVQYRESDWDFVSRLMEEAGIFYFFENGEDHTVMVLADRASAHPEIPGEASVPYREPGIGTRQREEVYELRLAQQVCHGAVTLRDFDFTRPSQLLEEHEEDTSREAQGERRLEYYDYPGDWVQEANGSDVARVRLEEARALHQVAAGQTDIARLLPGHRFTLEDHPYESREQEYLVVALEHWGGQEQAAGEEAGRQEELVYRNAFQAIPSGVIFRPPRLTQRPRVQGPQTAIVVGPSGEEIHTDEHGRVKVQFHWDREGERDERSSCWIRVSQNWAGAGWGVMQIPRIGQEVIVDFLEGDPDRPIITGRVYNGENPPPYGLPGEKTKSTIKSDSSLGGGGSNELRFEDAKGSEEVYLHAEKDWDIVVENNKTQRIGNDETSHVGHDRTRQVGHDEVVRIGNMRRKYITGQEIIWVGITRQTDIAYDDALMIKRDYFMVVDNNVDMIVKGNRTLTLAGNQINQIAGNLDETVGGRHQLNISKVQVVNVGQNASLVAGGDCLLSSGKKISIDGTDQVDIICGSAQLTMKKNGDITLKGKNITIDASGKLTMKATGSVTLKGQTVTHN
jgi:type VI secretion system secreted protein VgrG